MILCLLNRVGFVEVRWLYRTSRITVRKKFLTVTSIFFGVTKLGLCNVE